MGETTWAIWREKDGREGTIVHGNVCWDWLTASAYAYDTRFIEDFEAREWMTFGEQPRGDHHEICVPVVREE